jgi:hypothetical protein
MSNSDGTLANFCVTFATNNLSQVIFWCNNFGKGNSGSFTYNSNNKLPVSFNKFKDEQSLLITIVDMVQSSSATISQSVL